MSLALGVLMGAGLILACQYLGTAKFTAPVRSQHKSPILTPAEAPKSGAVTQTPRATFKNMNAYLRDIEAKVSKMDPAKREKIQQVIESRNL